MLAYIHNLPIRVKLIVITMSTLTVGLVCMASALLIYDRLASRDALKDEMSVLAAMTSQRSALALVLLDGKKVHQNLSALGRHKYIDLACLYDGSSQIFVAHTFPYTSAQGRTVAALCPNAFPDKTYWFTLTHLHVVEPVLRGGETVGTLYVRTSLRGFSERFKAFILFSVFCVVAVGGVVYFLILRLQALLSKPIQDLSDVAARVSLEHDYSRRADFEGEDEVGNLVRSFNLMMDTIESAQSELERLAFRDTLTGLYNRRHYMSALSDSIAECRQHQLQHAVLLIDLDGFKAVNDNYGHEVGDAVLIAVGERLQSVLTPGDLLARLGGDEFTIMLSQVQDVWQVGSLAQRIISLIEEPIHTEQGPYCYVSASVGIAMCPDDGTDASTLLKRADESMFDVKDAGKNSFVFFNKTYQLKHRALDVDTVTVADALEKDRVVSFIEPITDLKSFDLVGFDLSFSLQIDQFQPKPFFRYLNNCDSKAVLRDYNTWLVDQVARGFESVPEMLLKSVKFVTIPLCARQLFCGNFDESMHRIAQILDAYGVRVIPFLKEVDLKRLVEKGHVFEKGDDGRFMLGVECSTRGDLRFVEELDRLNIGCVRIRCSDATRRADLNYDTTQDYLTQLMVIFANRGGFGCIVSGLETQANLERYQRLDCTFGEGVVLGEKVLLSRLFSMLDKVG